MGLPIALRWFPLLHIVDRRPGGAQQGRSRPCSKRETFGVGLLLQGEQFVVVKPDLQHPFTRLGLFGSSPLAF